MRIPLTGIDRVTGLPRRVLAAALSGCLLSAGFIPSAIAESEPRAPRLSAVQDTDPLIPEREDVRRLPERWKTLWREALTSPEQDLRREAAEAILREHQFGNDSVDDLGEELASAFAATDDHDARQTIAVALIELDHSAAAEQLFEYSESAGTPAAMFVEPALAKWNYEPIREVWLRRLDAYIATPRRQRLLAVDGVRRVGEQRAAEPLRIIVLDRAVEPGLRLPSADALGTLQETGLTDDARRLAADTSPRGIIDRLIAVGLLSKHDGENVREILLTLALDREPTVSRRALRRLLEIDPDLVRPLIPQLLENADGPVRRLAAQSLIDRTVVDDFLVLGELLNDRHPDVRSHVRESLREHAKREEFSSIIRRRAMEILEGDDWRGQEQSALLLAQLDHKEAADLLLQRLESDRPEVQVTVGWALRELAVPETLPHMLSFVEGLLEGYNGAKVGPGHDLCLSHLFEAFGQMRYSDPEPILITFVPRRYDVSGRSRGAAVWALGLLHENDPQPELLRMFGDRVRDDGTLPAPEAMEVRVNSAVAIGRMKAPEAVQGLRIMYSMYKPGSRLREACGWALEQITGEDLPDPVPFDVAPQTPFLQPFLE